MTDIKSRKISIEDKPDTSSLDLAEIPEDVLSSLGPRVRAVRDYFRMNQTDFSRSLGIAQGFLSEVERGIRVPSDTLILALMYRYKINRVWLETGKGPMTREEASGCILKNLTPTVLLVSKIGKKPEMPLEDYYAAPLVDGKIAAGPGRMITEDEIKSLVWIYAPELRDRRNHHLTAVQIAERTGGDSMTPTLYPGDIVLVDHDDPKTYEDLKNGKIYAIRTGSIDAGCAVKRIFKANGNLLIVSDNSANYPPEIAWTDNVQKLVIGRVVWAWRNILDA